MHSSESDHQFIIIKQLQFQNQFLSRAVFVMSQEFWKRFFLDAHIGPQHVQIYTKIFVENRIQKEHLPDLSKECLKDMGIVAMGDIIGILKLSSNYFPVNSVEEKPEKESAVPKTIKIGRSNESAVSSSSVCKEEVPVPKFRRVTPEIEGKYKVIYPKGTTERSRAILEKRNSVSATENSNNSTEIRKRPWNSLNPASKTPTTGVKRTLNGISQIQTSRMYSDLERKTASRNTSAGATVTNPKFKVTLPSKSDIYSHSEAKVRKIATPKDTAESVFNRLGSGKALNKTKGSILSRLG